MINRPSYAQLTLELTRRSLQCMPSYLTPTVSGLLMVPAGAVMASPPAETVVAAPLARLVDLRRWKRKSAAPVQRGAQHSRTVAHHRTPVR